MATHRNFILIFRRPDVYSVPRDDVQQIASLEFELHVIDSAHANHRPAGMY